MSRYLIRKTVVGVFGAAMALCAPTVPAQAQSDGYCYEDILYCKYHSRYYASFQDCLDQNKTFFCPSERAAATATPLAWERNTLRKDHV